MAIIDIAVPDIGDFDEVTVIELLAKPGDTIKADQSLLTVESDKASMEIPSSSAGVVKEIKVKLGDKVRQGSIVLSLEIAEAGTPAVVAAPKEALRQDPPAPDAINSVAKAVTAPASSAGVVEIRVPDIGDFKDVTVIEVLVKAGDAIKVEQSLVTVESDKASMEIPASSAGVLKELKVKLGDTINIGDLLAVLEGTARAPSPQPSPAPGEEANPKPISNFLPLPQTGEGRGEGTSAAAPHNPTTAPTGTLPHASPSVRKFARELGVPLAEVKGAGPKGRITLDDVQAFTKSVMAGAVQTVAQAAKTPAAVPAAPGGSG
ncbi:MAG: dihydrolipoamide acetyltransferase, partial [Polaromonas sp.]